MPFLFLSLLMGIVAFAAPTARAETQAVVIVPVADVWNAPAADSTTLTDDKRETQVLFGERVIVHESSGAWARIEAVQQPTFRQHNHWEGYLGWVLGKAISSVLHNSNWQLTEKRWEFVHENGAELPLGAKVFVSTRSTPLPKLVSAGTTIRADILHTANLLIDVPYLWGGLTPGDPPHSPSHLPPINVKSIKYGLDCSGLIYLAYRVNGREIPRDAHEQWMKATPITLAELKPADLIFSAKADNPNAITHVALYAGDGQIIEAPQTGMVVRKISFKEKYGRDLPDVESEQTVGDRVIYFGRFIP